MTTGGRLSQAVLYHSLVAIDRHATECDNEDCRHSADRRYVEAALDELDLLLLELYGTAVLDDPSGNPP